MKKKNCPKNVFIRLVYQIHPISRDHTRRYLRNYINNIFFKIDTLFVVIISMDKFDIKTILCNIYHRVIILRLEN